MNTNKVFLSVIVSAYNEEEVIEKFYLKLNEVLLSCQVEYEIIFVNDGSTDNTRYSLTNIVKQHDKVKAIHFSRNFGHEAAMIAGLDYACGVIAICMDADLQNPPDLIPIIIDEYKKGYNIVLMKRKHREDAGLFSKILSNLFYKVINFLSPVKFEENASDFFLIDEKVRNVLKTSYRERTRFLRGFIQYVGFKKMIVEFVAPERKAGKSKYNVRKLMKLSINAIASFSEKPLDLGIVVGAVMSVASIIVGIYSVVMFFVDKPVSGYTTLVVLISFLFSINLLVIGIIGKYLAFLFNEVKGRPIYIIDEIID